MLVGSRNGFKRALRRQTLLVYISNKHNLVYKLQEIQLIRLAMAIVMSNSITGMLKCF